MSSDQLSAVQRLSISACISRLEEITSNILPTCANCGHYDHKQEICKLASSRPPARVIVKGCPSWEDDIPF